MKPNIIVFFADQQRADTLDREIMPNLSMMADEGIRFDNAFTCQPVCGPARACLQTGVYASENGCYINAIPLGNDRKTLAEYMQDGGYDTAYVGKWHLASGLGASAPHYEKKAVPPQYRGGYNGYWMAADVLEFTSDGYGGYVFDKDMNKVEFKGVRADKITDFALDYIDKREGDKPFFMFLSHIEPHHQNSTDDFECALEDADKFASRPLPKDLTLIDKGNAKRKYSRYLSCCNRLDYNLGRIIGKLKEKGLYDNTVIIYTSDHGCHFKTRNLEYKRSCHDASIKVPLVIYGDTYRGGLRIDRLVSLIDLPATILSIAGINIPEYFRGSDISDIVSGTVDRDAVYLEISESQTGRCIRTKDYTYSVRTLTFNFFRRHGKVYVEDYLYDNRVDSAQVHNLIKDKEYKEIREELRKKLMDNIEQVEGIKPVILARKLLVKSNI